MKPLDNPADPFKKALAEATRTLAEERELAVTFSVDPPGMTAETVRLPQVSRRMSRDEVMLARGTADAFALRRRFHDDGIHSRYLPAGPMARDLYEALETARCEALGARAMPGTGTNIDARIAQEADRKGYAQLREAGEAPLPVAAGYLVRALATGRPLPRGADRVLELWRPFLEQQAGGTLAELDVTLADQTAYARLARRVIEDLGYGDQLGEDPDARDESEEKADSDDAAPEDAGEDQENSADSDEREGASEDDERTEAEVAMDELAGEEAREDSEVAEAEAPFEPPPPPPTATPTRPTRSSRPASTKRWRPRIWPSRPSSSAFAPISTSSSSR